MSQGGREQSLSRWVEVEKECWLNLTDHLLGFRHHANILHV